MGSGLSGSSYIHVVLCLCSYGLAVPRVESGLSGSSYIHVVLCLCSYGLAVPRVSGLSGSSYIRVAHCLCSYCAGSALSEVWPLRE